MGGGLEGAGRAWWLWNWLCGQVTEEELATDWRMIKKIKKVTLPDLQCPIKTINFLLANME